MILRIQKRTGGVNGVKPVFFRNKVSSSASGGDGFRDRLKGCIELEHSPPDESSPAKCLEPDQMGTDKAQRIAEI